MNAPSMLSHLLKNRLPVLGEAAKAVVTATNDPVMHNRWIPDEDWVQHTFEQINEKQYRLFYCVLGPNIDLVLAIT
jgi:hypothetical protein